MHVKRSTKKAHYLWTAFTYFGIEISKFLFSKCRLSKFCIPWNGGLSDLACQPAWKLETRCKNMHEYWNLVLKFWSPIFKVCLRFKDVKVLLALKLCLECVLYYLQYLQELSICNKSGDVLFLTKSNFCSVISD